MICSSEKPADSAEPLQGQVSGTGHDPASTDETGHQVLQKLGKVAPNELQF